MHELFVVNFLGNKQMQTQLELFDSTKKENEERNLLLELLECNVLYLAAVQESFNVLCSVRTPSLDCPIANSTSTQSQQPV